MPTEVEMSKQRLDKKRLYRLANILIILLTIYFLFKYRLDSVATNVGMDWNNPAFINCETLYPRESQSRVNCMTKAIHDFNNKTSKDLLIILLLPTSFFGGTWLYRYLFPTIVKEKKKLYNI